MTYADVQPIALAILTSIITGGFVLVFVEIGNRKNRENDKHDQIMTPFMHKLSAFFRYINWSSSYIIYPKPLEGYEKDFKALIKDIGGYGGRAITSGGDYGSDNFTAEQLYRIAFDINNIWYFHDKMNPCRLTWDTKMRGTEEYISKELKEINPIYLKETNSVDLVAKLSGDFYTDVYQPIEGETYRHEAYILQYKRQTVLVAAFVGFVLLLLSIMLFVKLPTALLQIGTLLVILMLVSSLLMLAINIKTQIKWWNKLSDFMEKHKSFKKNITDLWGKVKTMTGKAFSFVLSKMVIIGLLLSAWAIFSIEIEWIPRITTSCSESVTNGLNKVFLALSYSYVAGVMIYWFTVIFPHFLYRRKMTPVVKKNMGEICSYLHNMLLDFCVGNAQEAKNPNLDDLDDCKSLLVNKDWSGMSVMPMHLGKRVYMAFKTEYETMQSFIDVFINDYKDVLSTKQLLLLEDIRHSSLGAFLDFGSAIKTSDLSENAKEAIADMFCEIVKSYHELSK